MEQYAVTGIGIHNGLGNTAESSWQSLLQGNSAIQQFEWPEDNPEQFPETHSALRIKTAALNTKLTEDDKHPEIFNRVWHNGIQTLVLVYYQSTRLSMTVS